MKNKEILLQIEKLLGSLDPEESNHEAFLLIASTQSDSEEEPGLYDTILSVSGAAEDVARLQSSFLTNEPQLALHATKKGLLQLAKDKGLESYLAPLIEAIFISFAAAGKKRSPLILPNPKRFEA